jgi:hypothetical protein
MNTLKSTPLYLFALLISGFSLVQAQEQATETNSLKPGAWSLDFGVASFFTLTSFQGTTLSAKYQTSTINAWRAGISINGNTQTGTSLQLPIPGDTLSNTNSNNSSNASETVLLRVQYLWYSNSESIIHLYTGVGPIVGYSHTLNDQQNIYHNGSLSNNTWTNQFTNTSVNSWSIGASAVVGVEYFPVRVFSLHAEYNNNLTYQQQKSESTTNSTNNNGSANAYGTNSSGITHGWAFNYGGIYFGLSVYF